MFAPFFFPFVYGEQGLRQCLQCQVQNPFAFLRFNFLFNASLWSSEKLAFYVIPIPVGGRTISSLL